MKALTLHQPWAWAVAKGYKTVETRSRRTSYRGPLAIHAGKTVDRGVLRNVRDYGSPEAPTVSGLVRGAILCIVNLTDCAMTDWLDQEPMGKHEAFWGDFSHGRFAWFLDDMKPLANPIPCRGMQRLWTLSDDLHRRVWEQLGVPGIAL
jgi:hypothetical protein